MIIEGTSKSWEECIEYLICELKAGAAFVQFRPPGKSMEPRIKDRP